PRPLLGEKLVALAVSGAASPRMFAPPAVLGVVLRKLLVNASHFTESGNIDVRIEPDAVTVADTGIGMSPDTLRHVFEPFYRADAFSPFGNGFGLTIASRLARRFGAERLLDSEPGQATAARLRFAPTPAASAALVPGRLRSTAGRAGRYPVQMPLVPGSPSIRQAPSRRSKRP